MKAAANIKTLRVIVSALFLTVITMAFVGAPALLTVAGLWTTSIQLVPAVVSLSLGTFVAWIIITIIFGRIYCSSVCPLGTLQDIIAHLRRGRRYHYRRPRNAGAMVLLAVVVLCSIAGIPIFLSLLDPYSEYGRIIANIKHPALIGSIVAAVTLAVVGVMAWRGGRLYCNTICPVGAALSLVSRTSFFRIEIDPDKCVRCRRCEHVCKASCIDVEHSTVDFSRCVTCFNCLSACGISAIRYTPDRKQLSTPMFQRVTPRKAQPTAMNRRDFMASVATLAAAPLLSSCRKKAEPILAAESGTVPTHTSVAVTPPGALSRKLFLDRCTGCAECIAVCPSKVLRPSTGEYGLLRALHPVMDYDSSYCLYECNRCTEVCPTDALSPLTITQKQHASIGLASVTWQNCIHCGRCAHDCPTRAITMKVPQGSQAPIPVVDPALCIGCGTCQYVCPAQPFKAIIVNGNT